MRNFEIKKDSACLSVVVPVFNEEQIARFPMQVFENCAKLMKQPINQIRKSIYSARKARPAQQFSDKSEFVENQTTFLEVAAEMQHRRQSKMFGAKINFNSRTIRVFCRICINLFTLGLLLSQLAAG